MLDPSLIRHGFRTEARLLFRYRVYSSWELEFICSLTSPQTMVSRTVRPGVFCAVLVLFVKNYENRDKEASFLGRSCRRDSAMVMIHETDLSESLGEQFDDYFSVKSLTYLILNFSALPQLYSYISLPYHSYIAIYHCLTTAI